MTFFLGISKIVDSIRILLPYEYQYSTRPQVMSNNTTKKQEEILSFIVKYFRKYGNSPSFRDIAEGFGISVGTVQDQLTSISNKGLISWIPGRPRSIRVRKDLQTYNTIPLPLLGTISAGEGIAVFEEQDPESVNIPITMITSGFSHYCLRVAGFSMAEDGILDKDLIVVRQQSSVQSGDTVIAIVKGEFEEKANLKKFYHRGRKIELRPRNQELRSKFYDPEQIEIRGKFCGLIRKEE